MYVIVLYREHMTSSAQNIQQSRGTGSEGDYLDRIELTVPHTQRFEHNNFWGHRLTFD